MSNPHEPTAEASGRGSPSARSRRPDGLPVPLGDFESMVVDLLAELFSAYPTWGTMVGYHAVDGGWPVLSEAGRAARIEMLRRHRAGFDALADGGLTAEERIDRGILVEELERAIFTEEVLREETWDALSIVSLLGNGLFGVLAREYAPWEARGRSLLKRVEGLPDLLRDALDGLRGSPDGPVSLLHLETALAQLGGVDELVGASLAEARSRAQDGEAPGLVAPLETAAGRALEALARFREGLDSVVRGRAAGEGRLGPELFARKLRLVLGSDLEPDELRRRAWADHAQVRAEMLRLARLLWPTWIPDEPLPEGPGAASPAAVAGSDADTAAVAATEDRLVRRVLDAIATEHPGADELIEYCAAEVARIEAFCRDHQLISLPDEPMAITWTPLYMRAYGRAFLDAPGPLDRGQRSHFWITPPDATAGPDAVESYLREENDRALRLLCIHEGIPGHYLQLAASNRCPSLARTVFVNGTFAEGWAVYVTQVMMDQGYAAEDPAVLLNHWKLYLRAVTNAILDIETHTGDLTEAQAMELMVERAFQEEDEARAKWLRARLTSTQLSTYFVGSVEMWDLEVAARQRSALAVGAGAAAVPAQRIAGGILDTPGFDRRSHLETVIAHGTPPIKWLRQILLDGAA